jgi:hypothetical protein
MIYYLSKMALLDLWLGLYNRIHFFAFREAETLIGLTYKFCLSPNTQENLKDFIGGVVLGYG